MKKEQDQNSVSNEDQCKVKKEKRLGLGRGLDALFSSNIKSHTAINTQNDTQNIGKGEQIVMTVNVSTVFGNKDQPRKHFDEVKLKELSDSIVENGLLQPILLQKFDNEKYRIIAGERRFRAVKIAGLKNIQAIVISVPNERKILELALLENIQRTDLSIVEEARAYASLIEDFRCTHEMISKKLSKSRSHITNSIRILKMPDFVLNLIESNQISFGHAKVIAGLEDQSFWAQMVIEKNLTIRMLEKEILKEKEILQCGIITKRQSDECNTMLENQNNPNKEQTHTREQQNCKPVKLAQIITDKQNNSKSKNGSNVKNETLKKALHKLKSTLATLNATIEVVEEENETVYILMHCNNKNIATQMMEKLSELSEVNIADNKHSDEL
ncbi:MAG: ParB/RepB/Spo0J family partition protein [Alphaproteobacteria bacterium]|nr:ParB/RepB/Spo0J family partition protein [Rickettsiales bacterium]